MKVVIDKTLTIKRLIPFFGLFFLNWLMGLTPLARAQGNPGINISLPDTLLCLGQRYMVNFSSTVNSEAYLVQLSDASGLFSRPLNVGAATGYLGRNSGSILIILPDNLPFGPSYRLRMVAAVSTFETVPGQPSGSVKLRGAPPVQITTATGTTSVMICSGESITLRAITRAPAVRWSTGETGFAITVNRPGTYTAQTEGEGCARTSNAVQVISGEFTEVPNITVFGSTALCEGTSVELSVPLADGLVYQWRCNNENVGTVNSNSLRVDRRPGFYDVVITSRCGSVATPKILVSLKEIVPPPQVAQAELSRCGPGNLTLLATGSAEGSYRWFDEDFNPIAGATGSRYTTPNLPRSTNYYVATEAFGCLSRRMRVGVTVTPATLRADAGPDVSLVQGEQVQLGAKGQLIANNAVVATAADGPRLRYRWQPADGLSNPAHPSPLASPLETTTYTVTVTDPDGCEASDEVTIKVRRELKVPNGFSPNGDGVNDNWEIGNMDTQPDAQIEVFDRWGLKVFGSVGYPQPWDGSYRGQLLPQDVYFYIITYQNGRARLKGQLNLIR
jgi:gliding motility-associated-like protein